MRSSSNILKPSEVHVDTKEPAAARDESASKARAVLEETVKVHAQYLLDQASRVAQDMILDAEAARQKAMEEGFAQGSQEGYAQGYARGHQEAMQTLEQILDGFQGMAGQVQAAQAAALEEARTDLIKLAVVIAEKMLRRELQSDASFPAQVVDALVHRVETKKTATLRLASATLERWRQQDVPTMIQQKGIDIVADDSLAPGDFILETDWGLFDGRLQGRWQRILSGIDLVEASAGVDTDE